MRYLLLFLLSVIVPFTVLHAQSKKNAASKGSVKGMIVNPVGDPLSYATVLLEKTDDSAQVGGMHTTDEGTFLLQNIANGSYRVQVTYLGYHTLDTVFSITRSHRHWDLGQLAMQSTAHTLASVEVKAERPAMQVNGDTITFNPGSYKTETDATAEDLIDKIPALQTDEDGSIKSQGKEITKVLVDGKPFFEGNSKDALKMIPASILEKIEVLNDPDQEYDASDPEKPRVLNLVIKKDQKKGYYINGYGSAGNRGQVDGRLRGNVIRSERMLAVKMGGNKGVQDSYNYNASPFYRDYVNDKFSYRIGVRYNRKTNENYGTSRKENFFADTSYYVNQSNSGTGKSNGSSLGGGFDYKPNKQMRIRFSQSFSRDENQSNSYREYTYTDQLDSLLTRGLTRNSGKSLAPGMNSSLNFIYRFKKPGQRLETNVSYNRKTSENDGLVYALRNDIKAGKADTTDQTKVQQRKNRNLGFRVNFATPFLNDHSSLNLGYRVSIGNNLNDHSSYRNHEKDMEFDSTLSNIYRNHDYNHNLSADYSIHLDRFRYHLGVGYQRILTKGVDYLKDSAYTSSRYSFSPRTGVRYEFDEHNKLSLDYNGSLQPPSFEQLQPTINNTNPQHIRMGNPELRPEFSNKFRLRFDRYSPTTMNTINVNLQYNLFKNQIQNINTFDTATGVVTTQPQNVPTNYQMSGRFEYGFFLNEKSSVNLHSNVTYNSFMQRYNQTDYTSTIDANTGNISLRQEMDGNLRMGGGFKFYINIKEILFFSGGSNVDFSTFTSGVTIKSGVNPPVGQQYYNLHGDFDTEVELPWDMKYGIYFNYSKQSNIGNEDLNGYNMLVVNTALTKRLFNKKGSVVIRVNDVGNGIAKRNMIIDPDFVKNSPFADNTRFYTLSFSYTINKLGGRRSGRRGHDDNDED